MARSSIEDPLKVFRFRIIIADFVRAGFTDVTGLEVETDVAEYREGGFNETVQKSAALSKFSDMSFKRGQLVGATRDGAGDDFIKWMNQVFLVSRQGNETNYRRDFEIAQYNAGNVEVRRWRVFDAWCKRLKVQGDMNATGNENSIEEMTVTHEGFTLVK
jgi:phage tail-like protein